MISLIKQQDKTGCGLACVAMLAGIEYGRIKSIAQKHGFLVKSKNGEFYTSSSHLRCISDKVQSIEVVSLRRIKFSKIDELPDLAILSIDNLGVKNKWHWVVFERKRDGSVYIYDPEIPKRYEKAAEIADLYITHYLVVKRKKINQVKPVAK
ncbi:cysteine peptidase family C39 domain-containing protein [Cellvibrio japonicus]|uniref:Peptidase C39 family superfamily n=1 Tax=Cellvibrio japonicus (strain Ueda107) TaxID=498211 RepID=B3PKQ1_CELJU|nr:cysteine peptidase family C39 domain-containing protein [Cellvibrio japonicus]ACE83010.1 Peptidase C39 family superfamily [Cellvibrio japonicus Ueda107]QEI11460.1 hypothetical protein FY117_03925 [Cellvibrio japonicus]QEI15034.1 hypothetical protein FY116_03925 [Cellvibrio japonicus]QEI18614.1 hypothetical protein FY115_03925 [Cellvibrio japonicus]